MPSPLFPRSTKRSIPTELLSALTSYLPTLLQDNFSHLILERDNEQAWKAYIYAVVKQLAAGQAHVLSPSGAGAGDSKASTSISFRGSSSLVWRNLTCSETLSTKGR